VSGGVVVDWDQETPERARLVAAELVRLTRELVALGAELVVLFGSRARNRARASSDLDLLVVMPCDSTWTYARRLTELGARIDPRLSTDLFVYTPAEMGDLGTKSPFVRTALAEGRVLYQRTPALAPDREGLP
jgi:predicted nucleotidyltransferase